MTCDEHELVTLVTRAVPYGRARSTREIVDLLGAAGVRLDVGTVEAALITSPSVAEVAPGVWQRR